MKDFIKKFINNFDSNYVAILALAVFLYFGYSELINQISTEPAREAINAAIGVIFVIMTTMYMLKKQTQVDRKQIFDSEILRKKLTVYEQALSDWRHIGLTDERVTEADRTECIKILLQLQIVAPAEIVQSAVEITQDINDLLLSDQEAFSEKEKKEFFSRLSQFSNLVREDLDLPGAELSIDPSLLNSVINEVVATASSNLKNLDKFHFNDQILPKGKLVLEVVRFIADQKLVASYSELRELFPDEWSTNGRVSKAKTSWVVRPLEEAQTLRLRYFKNDDQIIKLRNDENVVVSTQWGENIDYFIKKTEEVFSIKIERKKH